MSAGDRLGSSHRRLDQLTEHPSSTQFVTPRKGVHASTVEYIVAPTGAGRRSTSVRKSTRRALGCIGDAPIPARARCWMRALTRCWPYRIWRRSYHRG